MKKIKLHQWSAFFFVLAVIAAGCSAKNFPVANNGIDETAAVQGSSNTYAPPPVILVADEKAKTTKEGELYYDDAYGYRYWKYSDGKYYLDQKYENTQGSKKKAAARRKSRKTSVTNDAAGLTSNR